MTKKKNYQKPSMKVYELKGTSKLLVGSQEFGYTPGIETKNDLNHLT